MTEMKNNDSTIELLTTKSDIHNKIDNIKNHISTELNSESLHSREFNIELYRLLTELEMELDGHKLPTLADDWYFAMTIDNHYACIHLRHLYDMENYDGYDESYPLMTIPVKTYSSAEYAQLLNINEVTVRQWIRRGKLRSAYKIGNDWRIPVLTEKPQRGFSDITYHTQKTYISLSQYGCFAMHPKEIEIRKTGKTGEYMLIADGIPSLRLLNEQDREKLEHLLIETGIPNSDSIFLGYPEGKESDHTIPTMKTGGMRN